MKHLRITVISAVMLVLSAVSAFADIAPLPGGGNFAPSNSYGYLDNIELIIVVAVAVLAAALVFVAFYRKEK